MSDDNIPLTPGNQIGRYVLQERLGAGGNATVFRAEAENGDSVAIKVLHSDLVHEEDVKRFEREYNILQMVDHDRILRVYETGRTGGRHWIAMEYVDGDDVSEVANRWQAENPPDRWKRIERVLRGLSEALAHLHAQGVIHRDLKPTNVLVTADGEPKLMDFGVIKAPDVFSTNLTVAGRLVGTVAFMAPEQITSEPVDQRADLYSLGAVLYVLLTNKRPIVADSIAGYLARQLAQSPRRPGLVDSSIPPRLDRICTKLLRKNPTERYETALEVLEALDADEDEAPLRLHGREAEMSRLREIIAAVKAGASGCVGVFGPEGSGRSALMDAVEAGIKTMGVHIERLSPDVAAIQAKMNDAQTSGPTVLFVDDLDRCHTSDLKALIDSFYAQDAACMVVFSAVGSGPKDPSINEGIRDIAAIPNCSVIWLESLERRDVIALLRDQGFTSTTAAVVGRRLHAELEGQPGPILAQVQALIEADWVQQDQLGVLKPKGRLERFRSDPLPLPRSVRAEIEGRLGRLMEGDRLLLEALSILGGEATTDILQEVLDYRRGTLDTLAKRGLVFVDAEGLHEIVCISNPRIQQVVLGGIAPEQKTSLHLKAAQGLLARNPRRISSIAKTVAEHFLAAGEPVKAVPLLEQAAQRAARRRESRLVLELTELALTSEVLLDSSQQADLAADLGRIRALRGRALYVNDELSRAREALVAAVDSGVLGEGSPLDMGVKVDLANCHLHLGELALAQALLGPLLGAIEPGSPERLRALRTSAQCLRLQGDYAESLRVWQSGLEVAQAQGSQEQQAACLLGLAKLHLASDRIADAREALSRVDVWLKKSNSRDRADCLLQLSRMDYNNGHYRQALARAEEAGGIAQDHGDIDLTALGLAICADCLEMVGLDRDAARLSQESDNLRKARGTTVSLADVKTPTAVAVHNALRQAFDHHEAGRSEYGATLLLSAMDGLDEGYRGLHLQLVLAQTHLNADPELIQSAQRMLEPILAGLSPELGASMKAREDVARLLGA